MFADLLISRQKVLQGEKTAELHRRASRWFAQACEKGSFGERAELASEAIEHALAAADYPVVVALIENHVVDIMNQWYAKTVNTWMQALPPEWSAQSPRTNLSFARMHLMQGEIALAAPYLERLNALFSVSQTGGGGPSLPALKYKAEWLALQSSVSSVLGKPVEALDMAKQALEIAAEDDLDSLSQIYLALAVAYQTAADIPHAVDAYQKLIQLGRASTNIIIELLGISALGLLVIQRGQLRYGLELALQGAARAERLGALPPICAGIYGELGQVYFYWCDFERAESYFQRAAQLSGLGSFSDAAIFAGVARSRLHQIRGDWDAAAQEIRKVADFMRTDAPVVVLEEFIAQQVNVFLAQNNLTGAEQALYPKVYTFQGKVAIPDAAPGRSIPYPQGLLLNCALRILLYRARNLGEPASSLHTSELPEGFEFANRLLAELLQCQYVLLALETLLLRGQLYAASGALRASLEDFSAALDLAEPEGYLSPFVMEGQPAASALALLRERCPPGSSRADFIQRILEAFPAAQRPKPAAQPGLAAGKMADGFYEPLTARELDVLRLMAGGRTYEDIAGHLVVSINTVRSHVKAIYGKLGVNNRTAAIEAARREAIL